MALDGQQIAAESLSLSESQTNKKCFLTDQSLIGFADRNSAQNFSFRRSCK